MVVAWVDGGTNEPTASPARSLTVGRGEELSVQYRVLGSEVNSTLLSLTPSYGRPRYAFRLFTATGNLFAKLYHHKNLIFSKYGVEMPWEKRGVENDKENGKKRSREGKERERERERERE